MSSATSAFRYNIPHKQQQNAKESGSVFVNRPTNSKSMSIHNLLESNSNNNEQYRPAPAPPPAYHYRSNPNNHPVDGNKHSPYHVHLRQTSEPNNHRHHSPFKDVQKRGFHRVIPNQQERQFKVPHYSSKQYTNMIRKPKQRCNAIQAYISYMTYTDITRRKMKKQYHPPQPHTFYSPKPTPIPNDKLIVEQPLTAFLYRANHDTRPRR